MAVQMEAAMLCDFAADYGGRISILGGCVSSVQSLGFPAMHQMYFVARPAYLDDEEGLAPHTFSLVVEGPDGQELARTGGTFQGERTPEVAARNPQMTAGFNLIFPIPMPLAGPGLHIVVFTLDDNTPIRLPVDVTLVAPVE